MWCKSFYVPLSSTPASTTHIWAKSWPIEYLRTELTACWQRNDQPSRLARGGARKPRSPLIPCQFSQILIDWTGSAILGHFVKAVKFLGIQRAGKAAWRRGLFCSFDRVPEPVSPSCSQQERGSGGIDNNYLPSSHSVPQHLSKLNRMAWIIHNIKCSVYTGPADWVLLALFGLWNHERITLSLMVSHYRHFSQVFSFSEVYVLTYDLLFVNVLKTDAFSHCVRRQVVPKCVRFFFFLSFWKHSECLSCISHPGNQMFSHSEEKIGLNSSFIVLLSAHRDLWSHSISFFSLRMFCLRISSLSCSQAYSSTQPDQSFYLKIFYPRTADGAQPLPIVIFTDD